MGGDQLDRGEDWLHGRDAAPLVRQAEGDSGMRAGTTTDERDRLRALEREVRELRQASDILRKASAYFAQAELDRPLKRWSPSLVPDSIRDHRKACGVEPICRVLPIAPSTDHDHAAKQRDPARLPDRARRDAVLKLAVRRVFDENFYV